MGSLAEDGSASCSGPEVSTLVSLSDWFDAFSVRALVFDLRFRVVGFLAAVSLVAVFFVAVFFAAFFLVAF